MDKRRLVVGISGATGLAYGLRVLELARKAGVETHLVVTPAGQQTRAYETDLSAADLAAMADVSYRPADVGAAIASGSFRTAGMIVAPCSIRTLSAIAHSNGDNLLTRAADVTLKERRRLVLMVRETWRDRHAPCARLLPAAGVRGRHRRPHRGARAGLAWGRRSRPAALGRMRFTTASG
jgi:4-hydroxy-3-polyprenylbenzoate decarboxylase